MDDAELLFSCLVDQGVFIDAGRRRRPKPVTDAGLCDDCWAALDGDLHAQTLQVESVPLMSELG